jgi:hypothetical protein
MNHITERRRVITAIVAFFALTCLIARADVITDWNAKAGHVVSTASLNPSQANAVLAVVQTAVYEAVNAITARYPKGLITVAPARDASIDAAVAAANRVALSKFIPTRQSIIDSLYESALQTVDDGPAKSGAIALGEKAAEAVIAMRAEGMSPAGESYRPFTVPAVYVPTVLPAGTQSPQRKPWMMTAPSQFRPGPPPLLSSDVWARDFNEIKAVGAKNSTRRTAAQTEIARFWEETMPPIYCGVICCIALMPGREVTRNARLYAVAAQAIDDALIAVMDAKYHYHFWRPITAIRNGDLDSNSTTERDPSWTPYIETPMHPEYPCAHCIVSGVVGTILKAEIGDSPCPTLTTTSAAAGGATRSWTSIDDFMTEVANARIYDGVHYRTSTQVGTTMGRQIGELAIGKYGLPTPKGSDR